MDIQESTQKRHKGYLKIDYLVSINLSITPILVSYIIYN